MTKYTSRADLLIAAGESIKMQEKAGIEPAFKLHEGPEGDEVKLIRNWRPSYDSNPINYEFPLAVVEGKPVFVGDELYFTDGGKSTVTHEWDETAHWHRTSWNPPKPKTVMVELLREDAEQFAETYPDEEHFAMPYKRIGMACRKALEK